MYTPGIESSFELAFTHQSEHNYDIYVGDSDSKVRHFGFKSNPQVELSEYDHSSSVGEAIKSLSISKSGKIISGARDGSGIIRDIKQNFKIKNRLVGHND